MGDIVLPEDTVIAVNVYNSYRVSSLPFDRLRSKGNLCCALREAAERKIHNPLRRIIFYKHDKV